MTDFSRRYKAGGVEQVDQHDDEGFKAIVEDDGVPVDVTGWKLYFTAKRRKDLMVEDPNDALAVIKLDLDPSDPEKGEFHVQFSTDYTGELYADMVGKDDQGKEQTWRKFILDVNPGVKQR